MTLLGWLSRWAVLRIIKAIDERAAAHIRGQGGLGLAGRARFVAPAEEKTLIDQRSFPIRHFDQQHLRPIDATSRSLETFKLKRTDAMPGSAGMYRYGPASIWISGPVGGTWWATVRFRKQEKDLDARSLQDVLDQATRWVDEAARARG